MSVTLSIIIVNFETPDYVLDCIRSIYVNPPRSSYEIIVIDNGSQDNSLELIRAQVPGVVCIETGANVGFAHANNLGINNARGNFILLLNSDTKILDNSLDRMLEHLIAHPEVGAVGPKQLDGEGKLQLAWGHFPTLITEVYRKLIHYKLSVNDLKIRDYLEEKYAGASEVDWISGSCLMARREALIEAGLFDDFFFMYFEDIDLCRRIKARGWQIHYNSDMTILHYGGVTAKKNLLHVLVEYRRSQIYFTRKYYGRRGVLLLKTLLFVKYGANFVRFAMHYLTDHVIRSETKASYSKILLSKKVLQLVFKPLRPVAVNALPRP